MNDVLYKVDYSYFDEFEVHTKIFDNQEDLFEFLDELREDDRLDSLSVKAL